MRLQISYQSSKPVYLQIVDQIKMAAMAGGIREGEGLPSIRPLAEELRVNRNTVAKAYAELESQGIIETQPGRGCFLRGGNSPLSREAREGLLGAEIDQLLLQAHHLQLEPREVLELVRRRMEAIARKQASAI